MTDPNEAFLSLLGSGVDSDTAGRVAFSGQRHLLRTAPIECHFCEEPAGPDELFVDGSGWVPCCEEHYEEKQDE